MGGDDRLRGGSGTDSIYGGPGTDRIFYNSPEELAGDSITGTNAFWNGDVTTLSQGADNTTVDRIQPRGAGVYDFNTVAHISFIDRIDIVSGVTGTAQGAFTIQLTAAMAASADGNNDGIFGDIRVMGFHDNGTVTSAPTTANITIDGSALLANQSLVVIGMDGSGATDPSQAAGGMQGNDIIIGGTGNDLIHTGAGDDTITGGIGNDSYDGGDGLDVAVFSGLFSDYTITASTNVTNGYSIQDNVANRDGTDSFANIEWLEFFVQTLSVDAVNFQPSNSPSAFIA
jgi:Ca2+-binding RTX toxin-like protein